jgi:transposase InsO family protein
LGVTAHPSAEWIARQLPRPAAGVSRRAISFVIAMAPMARPSFGTSRRWAYVIARFRLDLPGKRLIGSPWHNGLAERLIGSIRRDCLDHVVIFSEQHLRHLLNSYQEYYNESRTHLSLKKDAPIPRDAQKVGRVLALPILGGLHHRYVRV